MPKIIDLDELVINWAWNVIQKRGSKIFRGLGFEDLKFEVIWDKVRFIAGEPVYTEEQTPGKPKSQIVFKSVYENTTDNPQDHTVQTERCTVASYKTLMTKGFTKGLKLDLKFALPSQVVEATAGFGRDFTMESGDESTREEPIKWSINSTIQVPAKYRTIAELVVNEQQYATTFKATTQIRGRVVVMVTNLLDDNSFLQCLESEFIDIIKTQKDYSKHFTVDDTDKQAVKREVHGICKFQYGVEQQVHVYEIPLEPLPAFHES